MEKPFNIRFDFPLSHSDVTVALRATAELHHSIPYYVVDSFAFAGSQDPGEKVSILPRQEIRLIKRGSLRMWVHKDSERETQLSIAIGKAIEASPDYMEE
jgi:hypothetical protein